MSGFFDSEIVKEQIKEMEDLQQEIIERTMSAPFMGGPEKKEHVELMRQFLDKQKNLCFRIQLSLMILKHLEMKERIKERGSVGNGSRISMNCLRKWKKH